MTCQERRDLLLLFAAGSLDPAEEAPLRLHLSTGCPACIGAFAEAEAAFHQLPKSLSPEPAPESAWEKIETRIALKDQLEEPAAHTAALAQPFVKPPRSYTWTGWAAAALIAIAAGLPLMNQSRQLANTQAELAATTARADQVEPLKIKLAAMEEQLKSLSQNNQLQLATVTQMQNKMNMMMTADQFALSGETHAQPKVLGKVFLNKPAGELMVFASNVMPCPPGKTYQLWGITPEGVKVSLATGDPDAGGKLVFESKVPANANFNLTAVTDEPAGGQPQPTGQIQFAAAIAK